MGWRTGRIRLFAGAALVLIGGAVLIAWRSSTAGEVVGGVVASGGVLALSQAWSGSFARATAILHVVGTAADTVVIHDRVTESARGKPLETFRLTAWRLQDGEQVANLVDEVELYLLGAAGDGVWCTSPDQPVHVRHPETLAMLHDTSALVGASSVGLKQVMRGRTPDDPVFDAASGGVYAYAMDGRGYLVARDLTLTEVPRAVIEKCAPEPPPPRIVMQNPAAQENVELVLGTGLRERITHVVVGAGRVLLIVEPSRDRGARANPEFDWFGLRPANGYEAIALDTTTGDIAWRRNL